MIYGRRGTAVAALEDVNMVVAPGQVVQLVGPSGSGKSSLLNCLGAVIDPTGGRMILGLKVIYVKRRLISALRALRRDKIGFVFRAPYLIPFLEVTHDEKIIPTFKRVYPIRDGVTHDEVGEGRAIE